VPLHSIYLSMSKYLTNYIYTFITMHANEIILMLVPKQALVSVLEETRHSLDTGDVVKLSGIKALTHLNDIAFTVQVKDPYSFEITLPEGRGWVTDEDQTALYPHSQYVQGGYITQVKQPRLVTFKAMQDTLYAPGEIICDFVKAGDRVNAVHLGFQ
jgi:ubiquitin-activating enzyme E1